MADTLETMAELVRQSAAESLELQRRSVAAAEAQAVALQKLAAMAFFGVQTWVAFNLDSEDRGVMSRAARKFAGLPE